MRQTVVSLSSPFHVWTDPVKWDNRNDRTTIAGNSAHPISSFRGQGLNNALQDAALYVEAIGAVVYGVKSLEVAVSEYDAEILERGRKEIGCLMCRHMGPDEVANVYIRP